MAGSSPKHYLYQWMLVCGLVLLVHPRPSESVRVLCVGMQMDSHIGMLAGAVERLQDYGHELYLLVNTRYDRAERYEQRGFKLLKYHMPEDEVVLTSHAFSDILSESVFKGDALFETGRHIMPFVYRHCRHMMADKELLAKIQVLQIDLLVVDGFPIVPCNLILPVYLNIPFVTVSAGFNALDVGVPAMPHFLPAASDEFSNKMTLAQKFKNLFTHIVFLSNIVPIPEMHDVSLLREYNISSTWPQIRNKAELFISSKNYLLEYPEPVMPNLITVPGLSAFNPKPLDDKFSKLMATPHGVIIMTFGSTFSKLTDELIQKFVSAFSRLDQTIIWKLNFKPNQHFELPSNVHISPWLPQDSLLAHPNTKLFITHCGNGGQHEAVYHGVPMLGVPLFAEQPHNAFRMVDHGIGLRLNFMSLTSDDVYENIKELLSNPRYKENSVKMSRILKDRPMSGQEEAAYWINHVIQFGGAHLRSSSIDMPAWELYMLDMLAVVVVVAFVIVLMGYLLIKCVVRCVKRMFAGKKKEKAQ